MDATALALLVIVWVGHEIPPRQVAASECPVAIASVRLAAIASNKLYSAEPDVSAYCIALGTAADEVVTELLAPPYPSSKSQAVRIAPPPPP